MNVINAVCAAGRYLTSLHAGNVHRASQSVVQIAKANHATVEQNKANGDDLVSVSEDASWLPPARGYTEVEDTSEGQSEQNLEDKIQTKWSQVRP